GIELETHWHPLPTTSTHTFPAVVHEPVHSGVVADPHGIVVVVVVLLVVVAAVVLVVVVVLVLVVVVGVPHTLAMHAPLQQLWFVLQRTPSALQRPSARAM